jgi:WD40 repeat protein
LAIHPDKKIFAAGGYQRVSFYNISKESNQPIVILNKENSNLNKNIVSIGFQNKGHWIFTAGEDRTIKIWDMMYAPIQARISLSLFLSFSISFFLRSIF